MSIYLILYLVALCISALGWKKFLYFISIGYGFSIAGCAIAMAIVYRNALTLPTALLILVLLAYGCRLGGYLLVRERKSANYRQVVAENTKEEGYPVGAYFAIWFSCAFLYLAEVCPVASKLHNGAPTSVWDWIGVIVMAAGLIIEAVADAQKTKAKKIDSRRWVDTGLYKIVRCPNYLGEVIFWTGCLLVCIGADCNWWQWLISAVGYAGIVYIMFSGARRLEIRQNKNYGSDPVYQAYVSKTPILLPLVPIYSVARHNWLRG